MDRFELIDVIGGFRRHVASAGNYCEGTIFCVSRNRLAFSEPSVGRPSVISSDRSGGAGIFAFRHPHKQLLLGRYEHHPHRRDAFLDQGDVNGEFPIALDELFGSVNGVNDPQP